MVRTVLRGLQRMSRPSRAYCRCLRVENAHTEGSYCASPNILIVFAPLSRLFCPIGARMTEWSTATSYTPGPQTTTCHAAPGSCYQYTLGQVFRMILQPYMVTVTPRVAQVFAKASFVFATSGQSEPRQRCDNQKRVEKQGAYEKNILTPNGLEDRSPEEFGTTR